MAKTPSKRSGKPPSGMGVSSGAGAAVKWVSVESGLLRLSEVARKVLTEVQNGQPLNIVTVLGSARHGKSFLMNALTGSDTTFSVSPEVAPCTAGADLSPTLMPLSEFSSLGSDFCHLPFNSLDSTIGFVDMEGQGDRSSERDVRLATPFLLLSKVVIFNWMGLPNKHTILQRLVVMIKAAEKVMAREEGDEPTFGHLVLLMRDVKKGKAPEIEALVMGDEDTSSLEHDDKKDARERNIIRQGLRGAFKSIIIQTMHRPHEDISDGAVPLTEVSPGFKASLDDLRATVAGHLSTPHTFGGEEITGGERLQDIMGGLCTAVNSTEDICPPSVLEAIDMRRTHEANQQSLGYFEQRMEAAKYGQVLSAQVTAHTISGARDSAIERFDQATQGTSYFIVKEAREDLVKKISSMARVAAGSQEAKRRELSAKMQDLVSKSEAGIAQKALRWNTATSTGTTEFALQRQWNSLINTNYDSLVRGITSMVTFNGVANKALLTELGWALTKTQFQGLNQGTYKQVLELNRVALVRESDRKAKEEAERRATQLAQDNARLQRQEEQARRDTADAQRREREASERRTSSGTNPFVQAAMYQHMFGGGHNPYGGYNPYGGFGGFYPYGGYR